MSVSRPSKNHQLVAADVRRLIYYRENSWGQHSLDREGQPFFCVGMGSFVFQYPAVFPLSRTAFLMLMLGVSINASGQKGGGRYPIKSVKVIVPFAPGGGSDTFVRIIQAGIRKSELMPHSLTVINVPGAGGTIGSRRVKNAFPDGYTILNLHDGILSAKYSGQALYGPEAFEPIAATGRFGTMICVKSSSRFKSLKEMCAAAREEMGSVSFGANLGATSHFAGLRIEHVSGAQFRFIPVGGGAKRFAALDGDHIDVTTVTISEYVTFKDGGLRAIAILADARHPAFPEVLTAKEQGIDVEWDLVQYWWAPRGTPTNRIDYLASQLQAAMNTPSVRKAFAELNIEPFFARGEALRSLLLRQEKTVAELSIRKSIDLPNFPLLAGGLVIALGIALGIQTRNSPDKNAGNGVVGESREARQKAAWLLLSLIIFVAIMGSGQIPFRWLAMVFIAVAGSFLVPRTSRNLIILLLTAVAIALMCDVVFTKVLVIDLP